MGEHFHQEMRAFLVQDSRVPQLSNSVTQLTHYQLRHELVSNVLTSFFGEDFGQESRKRELHQNAAGHQKLVMKEEGKMYVQ